MIHYWHLTTCAIQEHTVNNIVEITGVAKLIYKVYF